MDIVVNINVDSDKETPKVEVKKKQKPIVKRVSKTGGVVQFPAMPTNSNPILDMMGIKET